MFLGVSKNIGGGFRIGIGTKLGSRKKPSNKELQTKEFMGFLKKVENDMNEALIIFLQANGQDFYKLLKNKTDLDELFNDNKKYTEFITLYNKAIYEIEKILYMGDTGIVAKRTITDIVYTVKDFINQEYPNIKAKKTKGLFSKIFTVIWKSFLLILVIFIVLILISVWSTKTKESGVEYSPTSTTNPTTTSK